MPHGASEVARALAIAWSILATPVMHRALVAQTGRAADTATVRITGIVRDLGTQRPIAGATVATGDGVLATSDTNGDFTMTVRALRQIRVHVRRIGYDSAAVDIDPSGLGGQRLVIALRAIPTLDTLTVTADPRRWSSKVDGFEQRRAHHNNGIFFTRADIERHQPIVTSDLVRLALGVRVMDSLGVHLFASARGDKVVDDRYGRRTVPCIMRVGVDGQIMDWAFAADNVVPSDIYGIEVYPGPGSIPREYAALVTDGYCGLVMIWTR